MLFFVLRYILEFTPYASHAFSNSFVCKLGGAPLGYLNWDMLGKAAVQGVESAVLFGSVYVALEYAFSKGWISKFE
jgi:hypothetical protein